jgi:nicotinamide-nucleotide amidase
MRENRLSGLMRGGVRRPLACASQSVGSAYSTERLSVPSSCEPGACPPHSRRLIVELINTGTELMLGRTLNTHQQWLSRRLADRGRVVSRQVAIPDTGPAIQQAVRESLGRADLVLVTGGLGPTSDDLTRELIAELLGRPLVEDAAVLAHIQNYFAQRGRIMPARNAVQAQVPAGARVLANPRGTAPGLAMEVQPNPFRPGGAASWLVMLPGPPRELQPMFDETVAPLLETALPLTEAFVCRTLRTQGIGESALQERIADTMAPFVARGMELGYCARSGQVDLRLAAHGGPAEMLVAAAGRAVRALLGYAIFAEEDEALEEVIIRQLTSSGATIAVAESCTGGCLAHRLTNVPGASGVFLGGWVTYSNAAKRACLGVRAETLAAHGAVSAAVAGEMAEGARAATSASHALAITGIAGPGGGTPEKPVGTVFIALASATGTATRQYANVWDRETFKQVTTGQALDLLRRALDAAPKDGRPPS